MSIILQHPFEQQLNDSNYIVMIIRWNDERNFNRSEL